MIGIADGVQREPCLVALTAQGAHPSQERADGRADFRQRGLIGELFDRQRRLNPRQVRDDVPAEANQESGENERDDPHPEAEQPLRHAQALEHVEL